jgi:O-succinylbenzoic acid--CoA ligase
MDLEEFLAEWHNDSPCVNVHTSGSTGQPKPMLVEKRRMEASARITCDFLGLKEGDSALLCMSLDYIAGKMMVVRALTRGLKLTVVEPTGSPSWNGDIDFAAMVPMQVYNLLQTREGRERLMAVKHLIIGGGAVDEELASALASFPNAVWSTYGMTETLSHIALRRLNGPEASEWYTPFRGVTLSQTDEGCLVIDAPAVHDGALVTNDIVEFNTTPGVSSPPYREGVPFRILGRKDNVICSGGVKIQAEEVERLLRARLREPYLISKRPDPKFGEAVVLLTTSTDVEAVRTVCQKVLPKYWQPRYIVHVNQIPLTETGKPARKEAERLAVL